MSREKELQQLISKAIYEAHKQTIKYIGLMCIFGYFIICAIVYMSDRDSTDAPDKRSGMELHIDQLSGCHYLSGKTGGLIPRISKAGDHYGCYSNDESDIPELLGGE